VGRLQQARFAPCYNSADVAARPPDVAAAAPDADAPALGSVDTAAAASIATLSLGETSVDATRTGQYVQHVIAQQKQVMRARSLVAAHLNLYERQCMKTGTYLCYQQQHQSLDINDIVELSSSSSRFL
jgi:hypothetical protein